MICNTLPCSALLVQISRAKKLARSSLKSNFLVLGNHLKINNLTTRNAILMKLTTIMYLHETFHLAKKLGRNSQGVGGRKQKTSEEEPENQFFGLISWNFQNYIKNRNACDALYCTRLLFQISKESDSIWGSYDQKTTQKQSAMVVFAATKTFENS